MNEIMKFDGTAIDIQKINGTWMFDLYAVGMALGQVVTAKGTVYANKKRIDQNAKSAEIKPVLHNANRTSPNLSSMTSCSKPVPTSAEHSASG